MVPTELESCGLMAPFRISPPLPLVDTMTLSGWLHKTAPRVSSGTANNSMPTTNLRADLAPFRGDLKTDAGCGEIIRWLKNCKMFADCRREFGRSGYSSFSRIQ